MSMNFKYLKYFVCQEIYQYHNLNFSNNKKPVDEGLQAKKGIPHTTTITFVTSFVVSFIPFYLVKIYASTVFAIIAPITRPQTGALIWKNDTFDNAMRNANRALKRYLFPEKPNCKLDRSTPIN